MKCLSQTISYTMFSCSECLNVKNEKCAIAHSGASSSKVQKHGTSRDSKQRVKSKEKKRKTIYLIVVF